MKHLQKFESFTMGTTTGTLSLNENIFKTAYDAIKSKIVAWKDKNIVSNFNKGLDLFNAKQNTPEVKNIINKINELPDTEKTKLSAIANDPNGLYNKIVAAKETVTEAVDMVSVKKGLGAILGAGIFLGGIANLIIAIISANFPTAGSLYNTAGTMSIGYATIIMMVGFITGAIMYISSTEK